MFLSPIIRHTKNISFPSYTKKNGLKIIIVFVEHILTLVFLLQHSNPTIRFAWRNKLTMYLLRLGRSWF